ncbi:hypothetical protein [Pseudomonas sp.]|uniref:hypothetical protein n=1 Tax=Pseudomonas sp. TaxID=306 RepID=UPI00356AA2B1
MASERISLLARNAEEQRQLAAVYKRAADGRRPRELVGQSAQLAYSWPGNVRELEHLIGRAVLKAMAGH